jgi:probable blue pigment (indigoidine) exporter
MGVLASLAAMGLSSIGFVLTKKWSDGQGVLDMTSWQLIAGGLLLLPFAAVFEGRIPTLDTRTLAGLAYVAIIATALAYVAWFTGLRHLPAGKVGMIGLLNPVTGVILGTLIASEPFGIRQAGGAALVLVGLLIGERGKISSHGISPDLLPVTETRPSVLAKAAAAADSR